MNLNQVTISTLNVDNAIKFYRKLGLKLIVQSPHYARFACPNGQSTFSVRLTDSLPSGNGVTVYFECDDLDAQVAQFKTKGITFEDEPNDKPWHWREASLKDLDGNHIILFFAGENRLNPPWKIK